MHGLESWRHGIGEKEVLRRHGHCQEDPCSCYEVAKGLALDSDLCPCRCFGCSVNFCVVDAWQWLCRGMPVFCIALFWYYRAHPRHTTLNTKRRNLAVSNSPLLACRLQDQGFKEFQASMGKQMKFCKPGREADHFNLVRFVRFLVRNSASITWSVYCCRYSSNREAKAVTAVATALAVALAAAAAAVAVAVALPLAISSSRRRAGAGAAAGHGGCCCCCCCCCYCCCCCCWS